MSEINRNVIIVKSSNIDEIKTRINNIKTSKEKINDECNKLSGPNKCGLYGNNLNSLNRTEEMLFETLKTLRSAYVNFETELSNYESTESKKISEIKVPKIVNNLNPTKPTEPTTSPQTEPKRDLDPEPKSEPVTTPKTEPATVPSTTAPSITSGDITQIHASTVGDGIKQVTISSPDNPQPEPLQNVEVFTDNMDSIEQETVPLEDITTVDESAPEPTTVDIKEDIESIPSLETIKDQVEIPLVEKSSSSSSKGGASDGILLAGGLTAVGALAFGAVQGVSALEKKKNEEEPRFIIKNEGDK